MAATIVEIPTHVPATEPAPNNRHLPKCRCGWKGLSAATKPLAIAAAVAHAEHPDS